MLPDVISARKLITSSGETSKYDAPSAAIGILWHIKVPQNAIPHIKVQRSACMCRLFAGSLAKLRLAARRVHEEDDGVCNMQNCSEGLSATRQQYQQMCFSELTCPVPLASVPSKGTSGDQ